MFFGGYGVFEVFVYYFYHFLLWDIKTHIMCVTMCFQIRFYVFKNKLYNLFLIRCCFVLLGIFPGGKLRAWC